jgi:hypothetical protein
MHAGAQPAVAQQRAKNRGSGDALERDTDEAGATVSVIAYSWGMERPIGYF